MSSRVLLDIRATLDAPYNLTELVEEACKDSTDSDSVSRDADDGIIFARPRTSGIELRERTSGVYIQTDAECRGDGHHIVPGGRVTPLPRK